MGSSSRKQPGIFFYCDEHLFFTKRFGKIGRLGLRRSLKRVDSPQGREIVLNGQRVLNFSSNDYLGLANDAAYQESRTGGDRTSMVLGQERQG